MRYFALLFGIFATCAQAQFGPGTDHPIYLGFIAGYGATTWQNLIPRQEDQNPAMSLSTPIAVEEGGATWGALLGYEFNQQFALEANYLHFRDSTIHFDEFSIFNMEKNQTELKSETESVNLMGKFMIPIQKGRYKIYSSIGGAILYRHDALKDDDRLTPTFGAGINYRISPHWMMELAGNYTTGFGQSELSPANGFFPFLYSITGRLSYRV